MSRRSPFEVRLSPVDRAELKERASSRAAVHTDVVRARIVLAAADGAQNVDIARRRRCVYRCGIEMAQAFLRGGLAGLRDRPRTGRRRHFGAAVVAVSGGDQGLGLRAPEQRDVPLSRWSSFELAAQAKSEGLVESISSSTVRRWLARTPNTPTN